MQIYLKFRCNDCVLPIAYKYEVQSFIYSMISKKRGYSRFLHDEGYTSENIRYKLFTFGDLYGKFVICDKNIVFTNGFILQLRSPDKNFTDAILKCICSNKNYSLCGNDLYMYDFSVENTAVFDDEITVKTVSPITVYQTDTNGKTHYFSPDDVRFIQAVKINAVKKLKSIGINIDENDFSIELLSEHPLKNKIVTVYKGTYITAWNGKFILNAPPKVLTALYDIGLGAKNSQGFGMFEIVS